MAWALDVALHLAVLCCLSKPAIAQSELNDVHQTVAHVVSAEAHMENREVINALGVVIAANRESALVHFHYGGKLRHYDHVAVNVYADDAVALRRTDQGDVPVPIGQPRTFRSYADGAAAAMSFNEDGSISGLFEVDGQLMQIRPALKQLEETPFGDKLVHTIQRVDVGNLIPQGVAVPNGTSNLISEQKEWKGTRWFPGCYTEDWVTHKLVIGMVSDVKATQFKGSASAMQDFFEDVTNEASFIYEHQMNFILLLGYTHTYEYGENLPSFADGYCANNFMGDKLGKLKGAEGRGEIPYQGATHLWTGCGVGYGVVGLAYVTTACLHGWNTGVNDVKTGGASVTFAHELGHNLGADHSFEEGQGHTGGIMDYGDGKLDSFYQFNTKYRKQQMCTYFEKMATGTQHNGEPFCEGKFVRLGWFEWFARSPKIMVICLVFLSIALLFCLSLQPCFVAKLPGCLKKYWGPRAKKIRESMCPSKPKQMWRSPKMGGKCDKCKDTLLIPVKKLQECICGKSKRKPASWSSKKDGMSCNKCMDLFLTPFRKFGDCLCKGKRKRALHQPLLRT